MPAEVMACCTERFPSPLPSSTPPMSPSNTPEAKETKEIAQEFLSTKLGRRKRNLRLRKEVEILIKLSEDMESKHEILLNNMFSSTRLDVTPQNAHDVFQTVSEQLFSVSPENTLPHKVNWGRIASLLTFASKMAAYCEKHDIVESDKVTNWTCTALLKHTGWIKREGRGWSGFVETYGRESNEKKIFGGLLAASFGLGALAATALYMKS